MVTLRDTTDDNLRIELISQIEHIFDTFISTHHSQTTTFDRTDDTQHLEMQQQELKATLTSLESERVTIESSLQQVRIEKDQYFKEKTQAEEETRIRERDYYEQKRAYDALCAKQEMVLFKQQELSLRRQKHEEEKQEALVLVGDEALRVPETHVANEQWTRDAQENLRRQIERIKIKIEDIGGGGGSDVLNEYEEKVARDQFLAKELVDLENAIAELRGLIRELRETIDREFKTGVEKINKQFNEFFGLMFGGGGAFLSIVVEHKRPSKDDEEQEVPVDTGEEFQFERGIEINVSLPHKKVKELAMLSGGERSLTSIALLFAMSQVNPPPFLVLDETDAALDEANSRRYGDMIENLSKYSQLIVVTHNRETMSRAKVLYGVTIGADGGSKLLSIKFDDAIKIAK
jgi:chromosome segregation protein